MGGACDRVLVHPGPWGEEPGDEVEAVLRRRGGDDDAARRDALERGEVGAQRAHRVLVGDFQEVVEAGLPNVARRDAERGGEPVGSRRGNRARAGEVELDPVAAAVGGEAAALGGEARLGALRQEAVLPQHVGAGQRRMAAQRHLDGGGEPAQPPGVVLAVQERSLRQIHLAGDGLHPGVSAWAREDADGGGVAGERFARERVHLHDAERHGWQDTTSSATVSRRRFNSRSTAGRPRLRALVR